MTPTNLTSRLIFDDPQKRSRVFSHQRNDLLTTGHSLVLLADNQKPPSTDIQSQFPANQEPPCTSLTLSANQEPQCTPSKCLTNQEPSCIPSPANQEPQCIPSTCSTSQEPPSPGNQEPPPSPAPQMPGQAQGQGDRSGLGCGMEFTDINYVLKKIDKELDKPYEEWRRAMDQVCTLVYVCAWVGTLVCMCVLVGMDVRSVCVLIGMWYVSV